MEMCLQLKQIQGGFWFSALYTFAINSTLLQQAASCNYSPASQEIHIFFLITLITTDSL